MVKVEKVKIGELTHYLRKHKVVIPEFQRGYVWSDKQVKDLYDSIVKKYPIGTIVLWKTSQRIGFRNMFNIKLNNFGHKTFVIDGQQRLLTLYYLLNQKDFLQVQREFEEVYEGKSHKIVKFEQFYNKGKSLEKSFNSNCNFDSKEMYRLIGKKYKLPILIIDLKEVRQAIEVFERINQAGTRISSDAIFLSESWNKKSNLGKMLRNWRYKIKNNNLNKIDNIIFVHALSVIAQLEEQSKKKSRASVDISLKQLKKVAIDIRKEKSAKYQKMLRRVMSAAEDAWSFVEREFKVRSIRSIPSQTLLTILMVYYYYHANKTEHKSQVKELKKWFWRASFSNRYVGRGYGDNVKKDVVFMKDLAQKRKKIKIGKAYFKYEDLKNIDIHTGRSSIRNAIKLMFWNLGPTWIDGTSINIDETASAKRKKQDDHFYPYNLSKQYKQIGNSINSILNLNFIPQLKNASKNAYLPSYWYNQLKEKSTIEDQKKFFKTTLLPFKDINSLINAESHLGGRKRKLKINRFLKYYDEFLFKRFELFTKRISLLQSGKIK